MMGKISKITAIAAAMTAFMSITVFAAPSTVYLVKDDGIYEYDYTKINHEEYRNDFKNSLSETLNEQGDIIVHDSEGKIIKLDTVRGYEESLKDNSLLTTAPDSDYQVVINENGEVETVSSNEPQESYALADTIEIDGVTYYYGNGTEGGTFTVNGNQVTPTAVNKEKTIFKYTAGTPSQDPVYGTVPMTYAQYYYGELKDKGLQAPVPQDTLVDTAATVGSWESYNENGLYDAVSSATSKTGSHSADFPAILNYTPGLDDFATNPESQMKIDGIKTVDILVPYDLYVNTRITDAMNQSSLVGTALKDFVKSSETPAAAKTLLANGVFSKAETVDASKADAAIANGGATTTVSYTSSYGQYALKITLDHFIDRTAQDTEFRAFLANLYAVMLEDENHNPYGAVHYEDIWDEGSHFGYIDFVLSDGYVEAGSRRHKYDISRFAGIFEDGVIKSGTYKIIIKSRGYKDITSTVYIATKINGTMTVATPVTWTYGADNIIPVTIADISAADYEYDKFTLTKGSGATAVELVPGEDYIWNYAGRTITIKDTPKTGLGSYTAALSHDKYSPIRTTFSVVSDLTQDQVALAGAQLAITGNSNVTVENYVSAITRVNVKEEGASGNGVNLNTTGTGSVLIFNPDGTVNTDAVRTVSGSPAPVFETGKKYTLTITATGYTNIVVTLDLTGAAPEPEPEPEGLKDGTYTAFSTVSGYFMTSPDYDFEIEVTISGGEITNIIDKTDYSGANAMNQSFGANAFNGIKQQVVTNKVSVEEITAVSSATFSSNAFVLALKDVMTQAGWTPAAPLLAPALLDEGGRTEPVYSAETEASLKVINENESGDAYYTTDGKSPIPAENPDAQKVVDDTITISPGDIEQKQNETIHHERGGDGEAVTPGPKSVSTIDVKVAAVKNGSNSNVTAKKLTFVYKDTEGGTKKYKGTAPCSYGYDVNVIVTTVNGLITNVEDDNTYPAITNQVYWEGAKEEMMAHDGNSKSLMGKTLPEAAELLTAPAGIASQKVDAVSGATISSNALKYAVIHGLLSAPYYTSAHTLPEPVLATDGNVWVFPNEAGSIAEISVKTAKGLNAYYTVDGTEPSQYSDIVENGVIKLSPGVVQNPHGNGITLKIAAGTEGNFSSVVSRTVVFANKIANGKYNQGVYFRDYNPSKDLDAEVTVNMAGYITSVRVFPYGRISNEELETCNAILIPRILLAQSANVPHAEGFEEASRQILEAVQFHLNKAFTDTNPVAADVTLTISNPKALYENNEQVEITLHTETAGANIYYTVDYSYAVGQYLSDPTDESEASPRILYTGPFTVNINHEDGGTVYVRGVAGGEQMRYSGIVRADLLFASKIEEGSIVANGTECGTFQQAVEIINQSANGGTIVIRDHVELSAEILTSGMPAKPCVIRSEGGYILKGTVTPLIANADLSFENIALHMNAIYANGYELNINEGVSAVYSIFGTSVFAGGNYISGETNITTGHPVLTIKSGKFKVYASGAGGTTLNGSSDVYIEGNADVSVVGAQMNATITGDVAIMIGMEGGNGITFSSFAGELSKGKINGELTLMIYENPIVDTVTKNNYKGSVDKSVFGSLYLFDSHIDLALFTKFKSAEAYSFIYSAVSPENLAVPAVIIPAESGETNGRSADKNKLVQEDDLQKDENNKEEETQNLTWQDEAAC